MVCLASTACEECENVSQSDLNNFSAAQLFCGINHTTYSPFPPRKYSGNISNTDSRYKGILK